MIFKFIFLFTFFGINYSINQSINRYTNLYVNYNLTEIYASGDLNNTYVDCNYGDYDPIHNNCNCEIGYVNHNGNYCNYKQKSRYIAIILSVFFYVPVAAGFIYIENISWIPILVVSISVCCILPCIIFCISDDEDIPKLVSIILILILIIIIFIYQLVIICNKNTKDGRGELLCDCW